MSDPNETAVIPELEGVRRVTRHRRDPMKGLLLASNLTLACMAGCFALWTHRDWLRTVDAVIVAVAVAEFARLLASRH